MRSIKELKPAIRSDIAYTMFSIARALETPSLEKKLQRLGSDYEHMRMYSKTHTLMRNWKHAMFVVPRWRIRSAMKDLVTDLCCISASLFDTGNKLEFVADISEEWGRVDNPDCTPEETVYLWRLRYPIDLAGYSGFDEPLDEDETEDERLLTKHTCYVVTSASNVTGFGRSPKPETYVFAVSSENFHPTHRSVWNEETKKDEPLPVGEGSWSELAGSYRGDLDHMQAIRGFQRMLLNPFSINKSWRFNTQEGK